MIGRLACNAVIIHLDAKAEIAVEEETAAQLIGLHFEDIVHFSLCPVVFVQLTGFSALQGIEAYSVVIALYLRQFETATGSR